jgi:hypothetical protein
MKIFEKGTTTMAALFVLGMFTVLAGCGRWDRPAGPSASLTTVSSTLPANGAIAVPTGNRLTATFSGPMDAATITATTFVLRHNGALIAGTVSYAGVTAIFTPGPGGLAPGTLYSATITTGAHDPAGLALSADYTWSFTTGLAADSIRPTVLGTTPDNASAGVSTSTKLSASFSEPMDPSTLSASSFTLQQGVTTVSGSLTSSGSTWVFTPAVILAPGLPYTATISTAARDLGGNALAAPVTWNFTTGALADLVRPTLTLAVPAQGANAVQPGQSVSVTFSEGMDPATLNSTSFTLHNGTTPVTGTVSYQVAGSIATFTPLAPLLLNTTYTARISSGAADLSGNLLAAGATPNPWNFTTAATVLVLPGQAQPVNLRSIANFAAVGGTGITSSGNTLIVGDVGTTSASTLVIGLTDGNGAGNSYTIAGNPGIVNGKIYTAPPAPGDAVSMAIATQAQTDAQTAYDATSPASLPGGITQTPELGGLTLAPGIYTSGTSFDITTVDLTLDAQGDPNAVWVFQSASTLTIGTNVKVILTKGAQAKNVFWHVSSAATLNAGAQMKGTLLAFSGVSLGTGARLDGRAIALVGGPVTLLGNVISIP